MGMGISTDYTGSPLMSGGTSQLTLFDQPGATVSPGATPSGGLSAQSFGLDVPASTPQQSGSGEMAASIAGAGLQATGSIISGALQSGATDDAIERMRMIGEMEARDREASARRQGQLVDVAGSISDKAMRQRERDFSLKQKHNTFLRKVKAEAKKQVQLKHALNRFAARAYSNAEYKNRLIRRQVRA